MEYLSISVFFITSKYISKYTVLYNFEKRFYELYKLFSLFLIIVFLFSGNAGNIQSVKCVAPEKYKQGAWACSTFSHQQNSCGTFHCFCKQSLAYCQLLSKPIQVQDSTNAFLFFVLIEKDTYQLYKLFYGPFLPNRATCFRVEEVSVVIQKIALKTEGKQR